MHRGYFKVWRKLEDSSIWRDWELVGVWLWCLMRASHKKQFVTLLTGRGKTSVEIGPGQFIFGRHSAAKELRMSPSNIRNRMEKLKKLGNLDMQPDSHYTIVTICNWELYNQSESVSGQASGQAEDRQRTGKGHIQECKELQEEESLSDKSDSNGQIHREQVLSVFAHYRGHHPRAMKNPLPKSKEWKLIEDRMKEGYTPEDLCSAIDGCHKTPNNLGKNETGTKYLDLELIVRDSAHVLRYMENNINPPLPLFQSQPAKPLPPKPPISTPQGWIQQ